MSEQTARCHWEDCPHGANCVHAVPPTQPPATPEADVRLTEAERASLRRDILNRYYLRGIATNETGLTATVEAACDVFGGYLTERVRVVEGERDAARSEHNESCATTDQFRDQKARAESAEAAHAALVAAVGALADEYARRQARNAAHNGNVSCSVWGIAGAEVGRLARGAR